MTISQILHGKDGLENSNHGYIIKGNFMGIKKYFEITNSKNNRRIGGYYYPFTKCEIRKAVNKELTKIMKENQGSSFTVNVKKIDESLFEILKAKKNIFFVDRY